MKALALLLTLATLAVGSTTSNPTVALVHGAFAERQQLGKLIAILERDGYLSDLFGLLLLCSVVAESGWQAESALSKRKVSEGDKERTG